MALGSKGWTVQFCSAIGLGFLGSPCRAATPFQSPIPGFLEFMVWGTQQVPTGWAHGRPGPVILEGSWEVVSPAWSTDDNAMVPTACSPPACAQTDALLPRPPAPDPNWPHSCIRGAEGPHRSFSRPVLQDPIFKGAEVETEFQAD